MSLYDRIGNTQNNMQSQLQQLKNDPRQFLQNAGVNVPDQLLGNPQAMVQHLIQTGQVGGPALQRVMPMMQKLMGK